MTLDIKLLIISLATMTITGIVGGVDALYPEKHSLLRGSKEVSDTLIQNQRSKFLKNFHAPFPEYKLTNIFL